MKDRWTDADEKSLLLAVIHVLSPNTGPDWNRVAALMGSRYTASAIRQHYRKIRQESDRTFSNGTAPSSSSSTPSSAATKGKGKPGRPKGSNGPGKRKQANTLMATNGDEDLDDDNDDDDLHARGTGAHGVKRDESPLVGKGRASKKVKVEEGDDGVVDALGLGGLLDEEDLLV